MFVCKASLFYHFLYLKTSEHYTKKQEINLAYNLYFIK